MPEVDVPPGFGPAFAVSAAAFVLGSLAQIWVNRWPAALVAAAVAAAAFWLLTGAGDLTGIAAAVVFLTTLVLVDALREKWF